MRGAACKGRSERRRVSRVADGVEPVVGGKLGLGNDLCYHGTSEDTIGPRDEDGSLGGHFLAVGRRCVHLVGRGMGVFKVTRTDLSAIRGCIVLLTMYCWL